MLRNKLHFAHHSSLIYCFSERPMGPLSKCLNSQSNDLCCFHNIKQIHFYTNNVLTRTTRGTIVQVYFCQKCTPNNVILDIYVDNDSLVSINSTHLFCCVLSCVDQLDTSFLRCVVLCRSTRHIFSAVCCLVSINSTHLFSGVLSCVDQLDTSFLGVLSCVINSTNLFCGALSCVDQLDISFLRCVVLCRSTRHIFSAACCLVSINSTHLFCGVLSCVDQLDTSFLRCVVLFVFVICHVSNVTSISGLYILVRFLRRLFLYEVEHYTITDLCVGKHPDLST